MVFKVKMRRIMSTWWYDCDSTDMIHLHVYVMKKESIKVLRFD